MAFGRSVADLVAIARRSAVGRTVGRRQRRPRSDAQRSRCPVVVIFFLFVRVVPTTNYNQVRTRKLWSWYCEIGMKIRHYFVQLLYILKRTWKRGKRWALGRNFFGRLPAGLVPIHNKQPSRK